METGERYTAKGLVVFDVEGVLLPKRRYIPFEATRQLGYPEFVKVMCLGLLYTIGFWPLESALRRIYGCFEGYTVQKLRGYYQRLPLLPGVRQGFQHLKKNGWKTVLISSGLPQSFIKELAAELEADYAFGLELKTVDGKFIGRIQGRCIKKNGKALILREILERENLSPQQCIVVADDRNNLQMFPYASLRIGFNPDFLVTVKSDYIVNGSLTGILPFITKAEKPTPTLSTNQIIRSTIHLTGFTVPFISTYILPCRQLVILILLTTLLYLISELSRIIGKSMPIFTAITEYAAVKLEPYEFTVAPIFYALGITLSLTIFPPHIAYPSIAVLTLGDGFASILGKKLGKTSYPFNKAKNLEGSLSGFIFAFLGSTLFTTPFRAFIAAAAGMTVESLPTPIDDNLLVPLTTAIILTITYL